MADGLIFMLEEDLALFVLFDPQCYYVCCILHVHYCL